MKCGYYWILNPPLKRIVDNEHKIPSLEISVRFKANEYKVSILTNEENRPQVIKLVIPGLAKEEIPKDLLPFMQSVREHMLTALRLSFDPHVSLFDLHVWSFCTDDKTPSINVEVDWRYNPQFNADLTHNVFAHSFAHREQFRLFSNGTNEGIPIQYRFLSMYKLIEMQFRRRGKWSNEKLCELARRFEMNFRRKGVTGDPVKEIHACRDKCVHVRTGKKREALGVSELNHKEVLSVMKVLPVMAKMGAEILKELTGSRVVVQPVDREELWEHEAARLSPPPQITKQLPP
jgi:hypothetical protein